MSYVIKHCDTCGKEYHVHENGKIKGACEHIRMNKQKGRHTFKVIVAESEELDNMLIEAEQHKTVAKRWNDAK